MENKKTTNMKDEINSALMDEALPVTQDKKTLGGFSIFAIFFACNLVTTAMLMGMMLIPGLDMKTALISIICGSAVGVIPLVLIGVIGQKTGLATMMACRFTFGNKGAIVPSILNIIILIGWSWAQAALGGFAINYVVESFTGQSYLNLFIILTEVVVLAVALFAIKGISIYEKVAMVMIAVVMGAVIIQAFTSVGISNIASIEADSSYGITFIIAFDITIASILSWAPMAADYIRHSKTVKGAVTGTGIGLFLGTILSMGAGALMICMLLSGGNELTYEPAQMFGKIGFGIAGAIVILVSVIAANIMCIYSSTMSFLNCFPKFGYRPIAIIIGVICIIGAVFSGILDQYLSFVNIIAVVFMPLFAILIADYFVIKKTKIDVEAVVDPTKNDKYKYTNGVNILAIVIFVLSAIFAYVFSMIIPLPTGATIPTFCVAFFSYIIVTKMRRDMKPQTDLKENSTNQ